MERYLYEVRPQRPIRVPGKPNIVHACSIMLTKDEVRNYMQYGGVYRKWPDGTMERVTGNTISRCHVSKKGEAPVRPQPQQAQQSWQNNNKWDKKNKHDRNNQQYRQPDQDNRGKSNFSTPVPESQLPAVYSAEGNAFSSVN